MPLRRDRADGVSKADQGDWRRVVLRDDLHICREAGGERNNQHFQDEASSFVETTNDCRGHGLWLCPFVGGFAASAPTSGAGHINRALDNGVTKEEIGEIITHVAFYAGVPTAANAAGLVKEVFDKR
ncbi:MAG: carboxymuconolactone decarboxylase family protein [Chloroflexi bacterium]|nr:carboxymuconolactone decarboxylase family protein [Chloroflexota bacterium]